MTPAHHAQVAAEAIRRLNHATITVARAFDVGDPATELYGTIGDLADVLDRLPQALNQVAAATVWLADNGRLSSDDDTSSQRHAAAAAEALTAAACQLGLIYQQLDRARQRTAHLGSAVAS